jgi:hypothetical protein
MEYFFISKIGDEVAGYVQVVVDGPETLRIVMSRLAVQWRHTSIPGSLLDNVHEFCCRSGFSTLIVDPGAIPRMSLRLLERCGFRPRSCRGRSMYSLVEFETAAKSAPVLVAAVGS